WRWSRSSGAPLKRVFRWSRRRCLRRWTAAGRGGGRSVLREQSVELVLVLVVAEEVVELGAGLQGVDDVLLRALAAHGLVEVQRGLVHGAIGAAAVQGDVDAGFAQLVGGEERGRAELGQVSQDRHLHRVLELAVVLEA